MLIPRVHNPSRPATKRTVLASLLVMALAAPQTSADTEPPQSWGQFGFINQFETDTDRDGEFDVRGGFGRGQFVARVSDTLHIRMLASYHGVRYRFEDEPTIKSGGVYPPWHTIHTARLNAVLGYAVNEKITVIGGPLIEASLENGGNLTESLKPGGLVGVEIRVDDTLKFGIGILGDAEIEEGYYLQPALSLDWTPMENVTVRASSYTTRGGELEVNYTINDEFEIAPSISYQRERFRLKERSNDAFVESSEGIAEDRAFIPALRMSYLPKYDFIKETVGGLRIDLKVGVAVAGHLKLENEKGKKLQKIDYDATPTLGVTISVPL